MIWHLIKKVFGFDDDEDYEGYIIDILEKKVGSLPSWAARSAGGDICPFCGSMMLHGPNGGMSVNKLCSNIFCGVRINVAQGLPWGEVTNIYDEKGYMEVYPLFRRPADVQ